MPFNSNKQNFTIPEVLALLAMYLVLLLGTWFVIYKVNQQLERSAFDESAAEIVRDVDTGIQQAKALLSAATALHYAHDDDANAHNHQGFFDRLRSLNDQITSIGKFERVEHENRADYELEMQQHGSEGYAIKTAVDELVTEDGDSASFRFQPAEIAGNYYPISQIDSKYDGAKQFIGVDLGAANQLQQSISDAVSSANLVAAGQPLYWPSSNNLILIKPTYQDSPSPLIPGDREIQANGGYWMTIKLPGYVENEEVSQDLGYRFQFANNAKWTTLAQRNHPKDDSGFFSFLKNDAETIEVWSIGESTLVLKLTCQLGIQDNLKFAGVLGSLLGTLFFLMLVSILFEKKTAAFEQNQGKKTLYAEREKAAKTLNAISDSVITLDQDMNIVHLNPAAETLLHAKLHDVENYPIRNFFNFTSLAIDDEGFDIGYKLEQLLEGDENEFDLKINSSDEEERIIEVSASRTLNEQNNAIGFIIVLRDVSQERKLTSALEYQANHDALTGCANRYYFESRLNELLQDARISKRKHAMCYMDLDQFKVVNDTSGHIAGDKLLCELTDHLKNIVRQGDLLARLGGDEFGLIIVDADVDNAQQIAEKVYDFFQTYVFTHEDNAFAIRASMGFVEINENSGQLSDIFAAADIACYAAKDSGRNNLSYYSEANESMTSRHQEMSWLPRLNYALQHDKFRLLVQAVEPIASVPVPSQHMHFEFLLRLIDEHGKEVTPFAFIQAAERYDLMAQIDRWVINESMKQIQQHSAAIGSNCTFSINLSGQSVADPSLLGFIKRKIKAHNINPKQLWFELTETAAIKQFANARDFMNDMREMGAKVALDDFGSGLSSFGYLKNLPIDVLKIDGQFVKDLADNPIDQEMVRSFNNIGKAMGIITVAEFVSSEEIVKVLRDIGVDYAQGFHIGKPVTLADAIQSNDGWKRVA